MSITGHCLCGAVRFELTERPTVVGYCHCTRCQRRSGAAASANAAIPPGALRMLAGEDDMVAFAPPDGFEKVFCGRCGGALFGRHPTDPDRIGVRLGALDPGHGLRPTYRQFVADAADWEPIPDDGMEHVPGSRHAGR
jgi:hypothetical protein